MAKPKPKPKPTAIADDESRCARSDNRRWRCSNRPFGDSRFCEHHLDLRQKYRKSPATITIINETTMTPKKNPSFSLDASTSAPIPIKVGQVWAFSEEPNCVSRHYARIDRIFPLDSSVEALILDPHPAHYEELLFVERGLPLSCGIFRVSQSIIRKPIAAFSHEITFELDQKGGSFFKIYPKKEEVWALYNKFDELKSSFEYKLVETMTDFIEEYGVTVAALDRAMGENDDGDENDDDDGFYGRQEIDGFQMVRRFERSELFLFSHRLKADRVLRGCQWLWEVNSSSIAT